MKRKIFALFSILFLVVIAAAYFVYFKPFIVDKNSSEESAFSSVNKGLDVTSSVPLFEFNPKNRAADNYVAWSEGKNLNGFINKLGRWNWQFSYARLYISKIDVDSKSLSVVFGMPIGGNFPASLENIKIDCTPEQTAFFFGDATQYADSGKDLFTKAQIRDTLLTYCLDANCSSFGKECILVKNQ